MKYFIILFVLFICALTFNKLNAQSFSIPELIKLYTSSEENVKAKILKVGYSITSIKNDSANESIIQTIQFNRNPTNTLKGLKSIFINFQGEKVTLLIYNSTDKAEYFRFRDYCLNHKYKLTEKKTIPLGNLYSYENDKWLIRLVVNFHELDPNLKGEAFSTVISSKDDNQ